MIALILFWLMGASGIVALLSAVSAFSHLPNKSTLISVKSMLVYGTLCTISAVTLSFMYL